MIDARAILNGTKSKSTVEGYTRSWKMFLEFCGSEEEMLKSENLARWRQYMVNETTLSRSTINGRIMGVRSIVKSMAEHKMVSREVKWDFAEVQCIPQNALMERDRANTRVRVTKKEVRGMVEETSPDLYDPLKCSHRALILVLGTSGLRISEAMRIEVDDIAEVNGSYVIRNVIAKGKSKPRTVPMSEEAYEAIQDWLHIRPIQSQYLFVACNRTKCEKAETLLWLDEPMSRVSAWRVIRKYGKAIGQPNLKPHDLRRFVGTQLADKFNVRVAQKVLGHASVETTARYYILDDTPMGVTNELF
jgi:integrase